VDELAMPLRKVTLFDKEGVADLPYDEEGQAKPCVLGVRWVNPTTFETIRARGGHRTGPHSEVIEEIKPTLDLSLGDENPEEGKNVGKAG
jgi:hypothetical protein